MRRFALPAPAVLALTLVAAAPAAAETPLPNARYDGHNDSGDRVFVRVVNDGTGLASYNFSARMKCNDGKRRYLGLNSSGEEAVPVNGDGTFAATEKPAAFTYVEGRKRITGKARTDFAGKFTQKDVATGTTTSTFTSKKIKCSSPAVPWSAYLDGSRPAPFRDTVMGSGTYRASGKGISFINLTGLAPGRSVTKARFKFSVPCKRKGTKYGYTVSFRPLWLKLAKDTSLNLREHTSYKSGKDYRTGENYRLKMHFFRKAGVYRMSGSFAMQSVIRRRGKTVNECQGTRTFTGRFAGGPANLF